jgi:hypothetical protein
MNKNMSHMEDVFLFKELPFPEYIVKSGYHHLSEEITNKLCAAEADPNALSSEVEYLRGRWKDYKDCYQAKYEIPTAGGAIFKVSVICGSMFYSEPDSPYEIEGPSVDDEDDEYADEPKAYQTDEYLMIYLAKLIAKAKEY